VMVVIILELHAEPAAGHRMLFVAPHLDEPPALDLVDHGAGVGTVMRTPAEERFAMPRALLKDLDAGFWWPAIASA
jgi:hypothetical protein